MKPSAAAAVAATTAMAVVFAARAAPPRLDARTAGWPRLVRGVGPHGQVGGEALVLLPGLDRTRARRVEMAFDGPEMPSPLSIAIDGGERRWLRAGRGQPVWLLLPPSATPGGRLLLRPEVGSAWTLRSVAVHDGRASPALAMVAAVCAALTALACGRLFHAHLSLAAGLFTAGLLGLFSLTTLTTAGLPSPRALGSVLLPLAVAIAGGVAGHRRARAVGRRWLPVAAVLFALTFGGWVRGVFLPSAGSWDTEYWKAWMMRAVDHGVARVYGDPEPVTAPEWLAQARGQAPLWQVTWAGRAFVVDYPPLAMTLWRWSWGLVRGGLPTLPRAEAENIAVKLPAVLGDVAATCLLLYAFRRRPLRACSLAALYWALPPSWLSSAVLGFLDGAVAPPLAASLIAAGMGQPIAAGVLMALAFLIKPTAALAAPALLVALMAARRRVWPALVSGAAVVALALAPFLLAGTAATAVVHVWRIFFQERLSGGFPNPWWIAGHVWRALGSGSWTGPAGFVTLAEVTLPARAIGTLLFMAVALAIVLPLRRARGPQAAALVGAVLVFAYGMLAVGVHENHPHAMVLLFCASGLSTVRLRAWAAAAAGIYTLNMLTLSALGRFYGPRHMALAPLAEAVAGLRTVLGIDLNLLLAIANTVLFVFMMMEVGREMRAASSGDAMMEAGPLQ